MTTTPPRRRTAVDWSAYLVSSAPQMKPPPVDPCHRCGTARVPDDELGVFQLCPCCSTGTLRPAAEGEAP